MTARPDRWNSQWRQPPHRVHLADRVAGRWSARRMSRRFADVGVHIPAARLREMVAGGPSASDESVDVAFAFVATEIRREQRLARARRTRRHAVHALVVASLVIATLNVLVCMGYVLFSLVLHEPAM